MDCTYVRLVGEYCWYVRLVGKCCWYARLVDMSCWYVLLVCTVSGYVLQALGHTVYSRDEKCKTETVESSVDDLGYTNEEIKDT
jgi:hypothetical protein